MRPKAFWRRLSILVPSFVASLALFVVTLGLPGLPAAAQTPVTLPVITSPYSSPYFVPVNTSGGVSIVGTTFVPFAGNNGVSLSGSPVSASGTTLIPYTPSISSRTLPATTVGGYLSSPITQTACTSQSSSGGMTVGATLVGTTAVPIQIANPTTPCAPSATITTTLGGQYCSGPGGEQIWVSSGASPADVGCVSPTAASTTAAASPTPAPTPAPAPAPAPAPGAAASVNLNFAPASTTIMVAPNVSVGQILTDSHGMTLYTLSADTSGTSTCNDPCAAVWLPLAAPAGPLTAPASITGTLGVITRTDGTQQVTYNDMPLYNFSGDFNAGDTNGQGINSFGGLWSVATP